MVSILMMSAKLTTLGLVRKNIFWNKCYTVKISVHDVTNKMLLQYSNYILDVVMWPKDLTEKQFFEALSWSAFNDLRPALGRPLEFRPVSQKG